MLSWVGSGLKPEDLDEVVSIRLYHKIFWNLHRESGCDYLNGCSTGEQSFQRCPVRVAGIGTFFM